MAGFARQTTPGRPSSSENCKGRHNERIANISVNPSNYRVSLQGCVENDSELPLAEDSDGGPAGSPRASRGPSPSPGPGPGQRGNMHVIYM